MSSEGSDSIDVIASKIESDLLQALASKGQNEVARALNVHEGTISKMKSNGEIREMARFLAAIGRKTVPANQRTYSPNMIRALAYFAHKYTGQDLAAEGED